MGFTTEVQIYDVNVKYESFSDEFIEKYKDICLYNKNTNELYGFGCVGHNMYDIKGEAHVFENFYEVKKIIC